MNKKYNELQKEYDKLVKRINQKSDECAEKGMPFNEMLEETKDDRNRLFEISQEMRLIQEPVLEFGKQWKGDTFTLEQFKRMCEDGSLTDNDGYGFYATEKGKSDINILPSDITENKYRKDFSHVIWFNR